jgi:hypothetical protein
MIIIKIFIRHISIRKITAHKSTIFVTGWDAFGFFECREIHPLVIIFAKFYLKKANRVKYMDVRKMEKIDGIWVATQTTMTTKYGKQTLHKTILSNRDIKINVAIDDEMFSVRKIEKGL